MVAWIPDISPNACQRHDECYSTCGKSKEECDLEFFMSNPYYAIAVIYSPDSDVAYNKAQEHCKCKK